MCGSDKIIFMNLLQIHNFLFVPENAILTSIALCVDSVCPHSCILMNVSVVSILQMLFKDILG